MRQHSSAIRNLLAAALFGAASPAAADTVRVEALFVTDDSAKAPLAATPIRFAVGSGDQLRAQGSGETHTTDAEGRVAFATEAAVAERKITLDNPAVFHTSRFVEVGIELDLVGRRALYIVQLDHLRDGVLGVMTASLQGAGGDFDAPLVFHPETHSWNFPGEPEGFRLTAIGARLEAHDMEGSAESGWTVRLTVAKQEFTVR